MSRSCTIYSPVVDFSAIGIASTVLPGWRLGIIGAPESWKKIRFSSDTAWLEMNSLEFTERGDRFSHLLLGTANHLRMNSGLDEIKKKEAIKFVGSVKWLIGVVSSDDFDSDGPQWDAVMALAQRLKGRIFTGAEMLKPD